MGTPEDSLSLMRSIHRDICVPYLTGWNLVSIPVIVEDNRKVTVFPEAISNAFAFQDVYISKDTLLNGIGYWVKFANADTVCFIGSQISVDTIDVKAGWNMIGSNSISIPTNQIISIPPGMMTSTFFGYRGSYFTTDTVKPGNGYWVKVSQNGKLILSDQLFSSFANRIVIIPSNELPPALPIESITENSLPKELTLHQNYPNPFNPTTTIKYQLPGDVGRNAISTYKVTLKVYNVLGQEVKTLVDEMQDSGFKSVELRIDNLASGVYFYRLETTSVENVSRGHVTTRKMIIMK
ncbi:MAG: T9SS type A sorting domain-containing protein [Ignavibacteriales bacterium]|nr:T9SS type A sorting domain-containing protein [Ignavibacteriales bacterium]